MLKVWLILVFYLFTLGNCSFVSATSPGNSAPFLIPPPELNIDYRTFKTNVFKASVALHGPKVKGGVFAYETGLHTKFLSTYFSARYFSQVDSFDINDRKIKKHWRFEWQLRFWPLNHLDGFFVAPLASVYDTKDLAAGFVAGYQFFITRAFVVEAFAGLQSVTTIEKKIFASPVFPRLGINLGLAHRKSE